ncbi:MULTISPECIES: hypothetical protein [Vibrio]|uniref:Uncharacterized protein n=2 Tax=Vibrio TaxID=662 RepID=A0A0H3ZLW2_9VIBR|nr:MULTISPECIES: hypothetical protein [Vibrio]AKN37100.1 hypothetical protein [Vibrio cyclitrophicus]AKN38191.1 hypothetical protein [Vibrio splendidus]TVU74167.1 hypothetical protein FQP87_14650 [Vibrio tasmaniensis]CAH7053099.1 conserved hypothetical protein [Vibrio chagasii]MCF7507288.1 hypothetical protein [Vibrio sp. L3-7]
MKLRPRQSHTLDVYLAEANTLAVKKLLKMHSKTTAKVINRKLSSLLTHILVSLFEPREATLQLLQLMGSRLAFYFH